ncbi:MAG: hypothetical protein E6Q40_08815 [Cupriavidus sp.]|nr:MAG: hypothetical protein E6Q40_08815 [Cupriavidus sp.]
MASKAEIIARLQDVKTDADGGIICPTPGCGGMTGVYYTQNPSDHVTRRRICGRCLLTMTTSERIVGGYTAEDIEKAQQELARWRELHTDREPEVLLIQPTQRNLFDLVERSLNQN